jgi:phosphosulfolactate synthase
MAQPPKFLSLPARESRPRSRGLTHVLDKGLSPAAAQDLLVQCGHLIDIVKVGWGIGYIDPTLVQRVAAYRAAGVEVSLGGTLLEVCAAQGRIHELRDWALESGITMLEVSNGLGRLDRATKASLVRDLGRDFVIAAEVGSKDASAHVDADEWIAEMQSDLEAGARWLVTEGRESGTVGIYSGEGAVRGDLIAAITSRLPVERIIFEAPNKAQQVWFVDELGPNVNLGNVATDDVLALETLRLGLRADTALHASTSVVEQVRVAGSPS